MIRPAETMDGGPVERRLEELCKLLAGFDPVKAADVLRRASDAGRTPRPLSVLDALVTELQEALTKAKAQL